jgi:hypothetical protein
MTTIVNTPAGNGGSDTNSGMNGLLMVVVFIVFLLMLFYFLVPILRRATAIPQVNVPDKVDVNIKSSQ